MPTSLMRQTESLLFRLPRALKSFQEVTWMILFPKSQPHSILEYMTPKAFRMTATMTTQPPAVLVAHQVAESCILGPSLHYSIIRALELSMMDKK